MHPLNEQERRRAAGAAAAAEKTSKGKHRTADLLGLFRDDDDDNHSTSPAGPPPRPDAPPLLVLSESSGSEEEDGGFADLPLTHPIVNTSKRGFRRDGNDDDDERQDPYAIPVLIEAEHRTCLGSQARTLALRAKEAGRKAGSNGSSVMAERRVTTQTSQPHASPGERVRKGRGFSNTRNETQASTLLAPMSQLRLSASSTSLKAATATTSAASTGSGSASSSQEEEKVTTNGGGGAKYNVRARMEEKGFKEPEKEKVVTVLPYLRPESDFPDVPHPTVLVSDIPEHYTRQHIKEALKVYEFEKGGYRIIYKSNDDELILRFESVEAAKYLLCTFDHDILQVAPYKPTNEQIEAWELTPPKARPPVSSAVAGRFLAGALGIRAPPRTPEAIKKEKEQQDQAKQLREAKRKEESRRAALNAAAFDE